MVNQTVTGLVVPPGHSTVIIEYRSRARAIGTQISYLTAGALLLYALANGWSRRRSRHKRETAC
jgi:hypothetical protein